MAEGNRAGRGPISNRQSGIYNGACPGLCRKVGQQQEVVLRRQFPHQPIIGLGLGPQFTGVTSDLLNQFTDLGDESLRWALVISLIFNLISALLYLNAGRTLKADLEAGKRMA